MKRSKEKQERDIDNDERHALFKHEITEAMRTQGNRFIHEPSYSAVENLVFGRLAFQGMNPEVEKMMEEARQAGEAATESRRETEVTDREMAAEYHGNLTETMSKKFSQKRALANKAKGESVTPGQLLEKGAGIVAEMKRKNPYSWKAGEGKSGGGGSEAKKKRFLKPKDC